MIMTTMILAANDSLSANESDDEVIRQQQQSNDINILLTVVYLAIFFIGVVGNICNCLVIADSRNKYMKTATNYYLFSLSVSDLLLLIFGLPHDIVNLWHPSPYMFNQFVCISRGWISEASTYASVLVIVAFTVERYLAICHPLKAHTLSRLSRSVKIIILIWLVASSCALLVVMQYSVILLDEKRPNGKVVAVAHCTTASPNETIFELSVFIFFIVPMAVITILYVKLGYHLRRKTWMIEQSQIKRKQRLLSADSREQSYASGQATTMAVTSQNNLNWSTPNHSILKQNHHLDTSSSIRNNHLKGSFHRPRSNPMMALLPGLCMGSQQSVATTMSVGQAPGGLEKGQNNRQTITTTTSDEETNGKMVPPTTREPLGGVAALTEAQHKDESTAEGSTATTTKTTVSCGTADGRQSGAKVERAANGSVASSRFGGQREGKQINQRQPQPQPQLEQRRHQLQATQSGAQIVAEAANGIALGADSSNVIPQVVPNDHVTVGGDGPQAATTTTTATDAKYKKDSDRTQHGRLSGKVNSNHQQAAVSSETRRRLSASSPAMSEAGFSVADLGPKLMAANAHESRHRQPHDLPNCDDNEITSSANNLRSEPQPQTQSQPQKAPAPSGDGNGIMMGAHLVPEIIEPRDALSANNNVRLVTVKSASAVCVYGDCGGATGRDLSQPLKGSSQQNATKIIQQQQQQQQLRKPRQEQPIALNSTVNAANMQSVIKMLGE